MGSSNTLRNMINVAPDQADEIENSINQVQNQIDDLNDQIDGVQNGICEKIVSTDATTTFPITMNADSTDAYVIDVPPLPIYLDSTKLVEITAIYGTPLNTPFSVEYGPGFGIIDYDTGTVDNFSIVDVSNIIVYSISVNWDDDPIIQKFIDDFAFGNDYLTRPLTSGATYGLIPSRDNLLTAKSILTANKNMIEESETAMEDYAS
jgi:hypothetical protein